MIRSAMQSGRLTRQQYILREVEAPFGYALADDVKFTVNANCEIVVDDKVMADNLITMVDKELSMLPSTGSKVKNY